jgi:hypothetical protein
MKRRSAKISGRQKTRKASNVPVFRVLPEGFPLYASKHRDIGSLILEYTRENQKRTGEMCLLDNLSWFADLKQAVQYVGNKTRIFRWKAKVPIKLLSIIPQNKKYFERLFQQTPKAKFYTLNIIPSRMSEEYLSHPYFSMTLNEQALFLFQFAFGYLPLEEQADFIELLYDLIKSDAIDIRGRRGGSIMPNVTTLRHYYQTGEDKYRSYPLNRVSFYEIDRMAVLNLCMTSKHKNIFDGIFVPKQKSFWFSNTEKDRPMDLLEYAFFRPHEKLLFEGELKKN